MHFNLNDQRYQPTLTWLVGGNRVGMVLPIGHIPSLPGSTNMGTNICKLFAHSIYYYKVSRLWLLTVCHKLIWWCGWFYTKWWELHKLYDTYITIIYPDITMLMEIVALFRFSLILKIQKSSVSYGTYC